MKKSFYSLLTAALVGISAVCVQAAETASEAVVLKVKGGASATLPGKAASPLKVGDKLPQGTVISTPGAAEVEVQTFSGSVTTIKPGSTVNLEKLSITTNNGAVSKQSAIVDLKVGSVVSSLDPSKKAINDYSVRTPKGVASARGTVYTVVVSPTGVVRTFVTTGVVVFINPTTGQVVTVQPGYAVTVDASGNIGEPTPAGSNGEPTTQDPTKPGVQETTVDPTIVPVSPSAP